MMFIPTQIKPSAIFGQGLFADGSVPKGTILCFFSTDARAIAEDQYVKAIAAGDPAITRTGTRLAGRYFTCSHDTAAKLNYFNHSFDPNCLAHCGVILALRDIAGGQELTLDYRTLIDATDIGVYNDAATGQPIRGFGPRQTLLRTARQLIDLIESIDDWEG